MDYKRSYQKNAAELKERAKGNPSLMQALQAGAERRRLYGANWQEADIDDVVQYIAPGSEPVFVRGKIYYTSADGKKSVIVDVGGSYFRVAALKESGAVEKYLDRFGREAYNYVDEKGKQHGRSKADFNAATHYKIAHRPLREE